MSNLTNEPTIPSNQKEEETMEHIDISEITRKASKTETKNKADGFNLRTFSGRELLKPYMDYILAVLNVDVRDEEDVLHARRMWAELKLALAADANKPFTVQRRTGRVTRLNRSILADIIGIDYRSKVPTRRLCVVEHKFQAWLDPELTVAGPSLTAALEDIDAVQKSLYTRLQACGLLVTNPDGTSTLYGGVAASAGHQKQEKLLMADASLMKTHAKPIWFGNSMEQFLNTANCTGADIWKARANMLRPQIQPLRTADGDKLYLHDVLFVNDVEKTFHLTNARVFGSGYPLYRDGECDVSKTLGDGAIISLVALEMQGQTTSYGLKGFCVDGTSSLVHLAEKLGVSVQDVLDRRVQDMDGVERRVGDYKLICGAGCWKFDKFGYSSIASFIQMVDELAVTYPGINQLHLLRQADDVEGEVRPRHLTRTLIQQWMFMRGDEERRITKKTRVFLKDSKTLTGALRSLTEDLKDEDECSDVAKVFRAAPWLACNSSVQNYLQLRWERKQQDAAGGKLRTEGQYPYITEDPVAMLECWLLGKDPNAEDLGVLREGEISLDGVRANRDVLCVRFPANFLTAKVLTNKPYGTVYASCGNVAILSVHDDILIRQDGDVDGDEMAIIYDKTAISMTRRMLTEFHPPVIVFEHGSKAQKQIFGTRAKFCREVAMALWRAKRHDSVGLYANLAMKAGYLASIAYTDGDQKAMDRYLLQMSAASTGAILAIDQVKGNAVNPQLIRYLDSASRQIRNAMDHHMPFVQQFAKKGYAAEQCLEEDDRNICDSMAGLILRDTGSWEFDTQGCFWNSTEATRALLNHAVPATSVRRAPVCGSFISQLAANWFNDENSTDAAVFDQIRKGAPVGQKDLLLLLWRNACSLSYRMEGATLNEKRAEYYAAVRDMVFAQADSAVWTRTSDGHVFSEEEKRVNCVNAAICDALELVHGNGLDANQKGSYAMFILRVFAKDILANLQANQPDNSRFSLDGLTLDDLDLDSHNEEDDLLYA